MPSTSSPGGAPANDALLVQVVRGALGRRGFPAGTPRINVSSCERVVTLHGLASSEEGRSRASSARYREFVTRSTS
jgi:osmotically-inducible protein OsmY